MTDRAPAGAAVGFPPPLIFLGFALLGPLLDRLLDRLLDLPPWPMPWWIGAIVTLAGAALLAAAIAPFRAAGEDPRPWTATGRLFETGVYARSRNPMYLAMALIALGVALAIGSAMGLLLVPVAAGVVGGKVIDREEAYLASRFGAAYHDYRSRVRRWL